MSNTSESTVYLITGANKGIGLGLVQTYFARPNTTVVATVRNDSRVAEMKKDTAKFTKGQNSHLLYFALDASATTSPNDIRERFLSTVDLPSKSINVLICNAGTTGLMRPCLEITADDMRSVYEVNTIGSLVTFQAFWPLMKGASGGPKVIFVSSSMGSIGQLEGFPGGAYSPSKAALNWIAKALHVEMEKDGLTSVALHPGWVQTDMGRMAAKSWDYPHPPPLTVEDSVRGIVPVIDNASRETISGQFVSYDGSILQW